MYKYLYNSVTFNSPLFSFPKVELCDFQHSLVLRRDVHYPALPETRESIHSAFVPHHFRLPQRAVFCTNIEPFGCSIGMRCVLGVIRVMEQSRIRKRAWQGYIEGEEDAKGKVSATAGANRIWRISPRASRFIRVDPSYQGCTRLSKYSMHALKIK